MFNTFLAHGLNANPTETSCPPLLLFQTHAQYTEEQRARPSLGNVIVVTLRYRSVLRVNTDTENHGFSDIKHCLNVKEKPKRPKMFLLQTSV